MVNLDSCNSVLLFLGSMKMSRLVVTENFVPFNRFIWDEMSVKGKIVPYKTFLRDGLFGTGMAAHGLVNGMSGASPTGMSEANLPRLHLRRARYRP